MGWETSGLELKWHSLDSTFEQLSAAAAAGRNNTPELGASGPRRVGGGAWAIIRRYVYQYTYSCFRNAIAIAS